MCWWIFNGAISDRAISGIYAIQTWGKHCNVKVTNELVDNTFETCVIGNMKYALENCSLFQFIEIPIGYIVLTICSKNSWNMEYYVMATSDYRKWGH